jgi:hypothetical protein
MEAKPILKLNDRNPSVLEWQKILIDRGFLAIKEPTGFFGALTEQATRAFQKAHRLNQTGIVNLSTWRVVYPGIDDRNMPQFLMIHTTAGNQNNTAQQIVDYHVKTLKWGRPGYSKIIEASGKVVNTWHVDLTDGFQPFEITYGAAEFNPISIHYCWIGGLRDGIAVDNRTPNQIESLKKLILDTIIVAPNIKVAGHNQFHNKACPCFWVPDFCLEIGVPNNNIYFNDPFGYKNMKWKR